jgi:hypothetical protein
MWKSVVYVDLSKVINRTRLLLSGMNKVSYSSLGKLGCLVAGAGGSVVGGVWALCKVRAGHLVDLKNVRTGELREEKALHMEALREEKAMHMEALREETRMRIECLREESAIRRSDAEFLNSLAGRSIWCWK